MAKTYQRTKLQEVTIRGYKSIAYDRPVTLKLGDVSILLGANGAGKSNIISFFKWQFGVIDTVVFRVVYRMTAFMHNS